MKKNLLLTVAVSVLALGSSSALAAEATGTGTINAKIVAPVSINESEALDFGTILSPTDGEKKVTIAPAGSRSSDDDSILVDSNKGKAAVFNVKGAENQRINIQTISPTTLTGAGSPMTVDNFVTDPASELTLSGTSGQIKVGADLTVGENQDKGDYTGSYTITVNY